MTRPTDEEIQVAAINAVRHCSGVVDHRRIYDFVEGARWALKQSSKACQLEWKRPDEELPPYCDVLMVLEEDETRWADLRVSTDIPEGCKLLAWARISLPKLEEK